MPLDAFRARPIGSFVLQANTQKKTRILVLDSQATQRSPTSEMKRNILKHAVIPARRDPIATNRLYYCRIMTGIYFTSFVMQHDLLDHYALVALVVADQVSFET